MKMFVGCVIRFHPEDGVLQDLGRVVHIDVESKHYYWIPFPDINKNGWRKHFIKAPRRGSIESVEGPPNSCTYSFIEFQSPPHWALTEEELRGAETSVVTWRSRRRLTEWCAHRDACYALIEPYFQRHSVADFVTGLLFSQWAKLRARELGLPTPKTIVRAARAYVLGGGVKNALLPDWAYRDAVGKPKLATKAKAGAKNTGTKNGIEGAAGVILTEGDRDKLRRGWKKFKTPARSVEQALALTHKEFYAKSVRYVSRTEVEVETLPENQLPTMAMFRRHGPNGAAEFSASRINLGTHRWERTQRPLRGTSRDGLVAAAQFGYIDSTPDDQTLASSASRLKMVSSPINTKVLEGYTGYILGLQSGFEKASTMTALMAIGHAASPKDDLCARHGIELKEGEWLALSLKRIRSDNGELKSEAGIAHLTDAEITAEFVRSYAAELKGPVESSHFAIARDSSHQMAGSTRGKRRQRGDERREEAYCLNYDEYMPHLIKAVLRYNNVDRVEHLLTMEMRRDGVKPTRGAILKWMISNGYVVSQPWNLDQMRAMCLPRIDGSIYANGVRLFDPRSGKRRLVPQLRFWSEWLHRSGLTERARRDGTIPCAVHLNPSDLSECWLRCDGLQLLSLQTDDPLLSKVTLLDWLHIGDDDRLRAFLDTADKRNAGVSHTASIEHTNEVAAADKRAAIAVLPAKPSKKALKEGKREATREEATTLNVANLLAGRPSGGGGKPYSTPLLTVEDEEESWMNEVRARLT